MLSYDEPAKCSDFSSSANADGLPFATSYESYNVFSASLLPTKNEILLLKASYTSDVDFGASAILTDEFIISMLGIW